MAPHATEHLPPHDGNPVEHYTTVRSPDHGNIESVAIIGMSFGFPQDATSSEPFWRMLMEQRNTATNFPTDRLNVDAMYHPDGNRRGQISVYGGNFIKEDIAAFDAPFFGISTADAAIMDPQQRSLLEYTYKALENAGMPLEAVTGTKTSVFTGCFTNDWQHLCFKDSEQCGTTTALGAQPCVNANRISWFFNFTGNSANIDTACSSSLVALDMGCKGLLSGDTEMSVVAGCNLIFSPDMMHSLTNMNMLSPDGRCYSFDHRGNGYGRGEGFGVLVLKRISDAIRDHDTIRGVIRNTACNQDGYTPGITQPNSVSQEALIRETYSKAGLSMEPTRYFEAHGTGTPIGDPIESSALGAAFRKTRMLADPLWVGAVKSNIGHLEGASGIAGVIKTVLVLEKAIIPPNALFERTNPKIDTEFLNIKFPLKPLPWPTRGLRRASVNSFGFAGTNAHVILDDAFHYLSERGQVGHHITVQDPPLDNDLTCSTSNIHQGELENDENNFWNSSLMPRLLMFSVNDEKGMKRISAEYGVHFANLNLPLERWETYLDDLAYTLNSRRSLLPWKSFAIVQTLEDLKSIGTNLSTPQKSIIDPTLGFIFTGQGAQWAGMGRDLMRFPVYEKSIRGAEEYFVEMGSSWYLREEMFKDNEISNISRPELSQPICTALQIALVDLLDSFQIHPRAVVGHSSGEIAAAYCMGAISARSAWKIAFFRGISAAELIRSQGRQGAMMSVGLSDSDSQPYIHRVAMQSGFHDLTVACINSPKNVTISGEVSQIDALKAFLDADGIFVRKLLVNVAYHSPHMLAIAERYKAMIQGIEKSTLGLGYVTMISTVTGKTMKPDELSRPEYWVSNLVSPVRFSDAVSHLFSYSARKTRKKLDLSHRGHFHINMLIEVGPHPALQGPIRDILNSVSSKTTATYTSLLTRKISAMQSCLMAFGRIKCLGYPMNLSNLDSGSVKGYKTRMALTDLPEYLFDHSKTYWYESRLSERFRTHFQGKLDLLGKPVTDWNSLEAKWRNILKVADMPWMEDHVINGILVYPAAGMLVMAIEAANQMADPNQTVVGFEIKDAAFMRSLNIPQDIIGVEVQLSLHIQQYEFNALSTWTEFRLCAYEKPEWYECCRGFIRVEYEAKESEVDNGKEKAKELRSCLQTESSMAEICHRTLDPNKLYETLNKSGFGFGPSFRPIMNGVTGNNNETNADIKLFEWPATENPQAHVVHPTSLDGMLHLAIAGYADGGERTVPTMIPTLLRNIWISKNGLSHPKDSKVQACTWMTGQDNRGFDFDGSVLNSAKSTVLARITGLRLTIIADVASDLEDSYQHRQVGYNIRHLPDLELLATTQTRELFHRTKRSVEPLAQYLTILNHKNPKLKVMEIDSGHDPVMTQILCRLSGFTDVSEAIKKYFSSYTYTNRHQEIIDRVRHDLKDPQGVTFRHLDTMADVATQPFELDSYDLIVASNFPNAKTIAEGVLVQGRKLLRVGGKLLSCHPTKRDSSKHHENAGCWQSDSSAVHSTLCLAPGLPFGDLLEDCGFLRPEVEIPASVSDGEQIVVVSSPSSITNAICNMKNIMIVADVRSSLQSRACERLQKVLSNTTSVNVDVCDISRASTMSDPDKLVFIVLEELDKPLLYKLTSDEYPKLRRLLISAKDILWINPYGGSLPANPEYAVLLGLARAIRNEYENHNFTTIALQVDGNISDQHIDMIQQVLRKNHTHSNLIAGEPEYIEMDGALNIPRVVQNPTLSQEIFIRSLVQQSGKTELKLAPPLVLTIGSPGLLDTLHFVEDVRFATPIADDEVEIETRSIGMNFKDLLTALGQVPSSTFGLECAGVVTRVGRNGDFVPGDRILMAAAGSFATFARGKISAACRMPEEMSFVEAAAVPAQFGTAWEVVHEMARLRRGESILIHAGAGGTGQAAIQIALYIGATVFATVGSNSKKALLMEHYGIPEDHIFYSRDISFAKGIQRVTRGRGVDVVINSLAGSSLMASWECIASYGRFIEIGKKDILSNSNLPMLPFRKNTSFMGFDASTWQEERPVEARRDLKILVDLFANRVFRTPHPLHVYDISRTEDVFRLMQDGKTSGKIVLEVKADSHVKTILKTRPSFNLDPNATYVIAGGLGGLGRSMARWMISRNARNLILLSRSGARTEVARTFLNELRGSGILVEAPACDVTNMSVMQETFGGLMANMPPVKGCIQGSMVRRDELLENMGFDSWQAGVECKTVGSWNLHTILPPGMDFFIFLSSASGLVGLRGQTNYAAGNTYEDALARYRVARGEKAVSLDLGAMIDDGLLAETPELLTRVLAYGALNPVSRRQFYGILDYFCAPDLPLLSPEECQAVVGLGSGGGPGLDGVDLSRQPMLLQLLNTENEKAAFGSDDEEAAVNFRELLSQSTSWIEAGNVVVQALIAKLSKSLSTMQNNDVDIYKPLLAYGVDSLLAVEIRNWIAKEFQADVAVFETLGGSTFSTLGMLVAGRSAVKHENWTS